MNLPTRRGVASLEARAAASWRNGVVSLAILTGAVALAIVAGKTTAEGQLQVGLLAAAVVAGLATFRYLGLPAWCSLLLVTSVAARGLGLTLGLPSIADFLHYPVALGLALAALDRPPRSASRGPGRWLTGFLLVVLISSVAHPTNPLRPALFLLIAGEPLAIIWAISRWGTDARTLRIVGTVAVVLAVTQVPIGVYQGVTYGWSDPVKGTLVGHGAGQHVLGGLFALGLFVMLAATISKRINPVLGGIASAVCLAMMIATGSTAVTIIAAIAAPLGLIFRGSGAMGGIRARTSSTIVITVLLAAAALAFTGSLLPGIYDRTGDLSTSREPPEIEMIRDRADSDQLALFFGSGPGTSASRASLLLVEPKKGSPLEFLGLEPTDLGLSIWPASSDPLYGGSVESAASSALGVIGDLGLVGLGAAGLLFWAIWRRAGRSRSWLAPAARCALLMLAALSFIDNWLEYPEFAVPFAILIGFVMSDVPDVGA